MTLQQFSKDVENLPFTVKDQSRSIFFGFAFNTPLGEALQKVVEIVALPMGFAMIC
jgi:hypothetical protein